MQVNAKKNLAVYHIAWMIGNPVEYFSISNAKRKNCRKVPEYNRESIVSPEISSEGLKNRSENINMFSLAFLIFGLSLQVITGVLFWIFRIPGDLAAPIFSICSYFTLTALPFSWRQGLSSIDRLRFEKFKKSDKPERDFKINRWAEPKIWDLLPGVVFSILFFIFLKSPLHQ